MNNVIPFNYQGRAIRFNSEGWIHATEIAASNGLRLDNWLRNQETKAYIEALAKHLNTSNPRDLVRGHCGKGGGYLAAPEARRRFRSLDLSGLLRLVRSTH
ncbi:KilA-N domain-containing protein [Pseudomonas libanensis]|uniref:KilA-N domain-containing protein n=1 Tax=Pseudomonas libanensis TaxID=75588 RepID=UPI002E1410C1